jgi:Predicted Zn-dependent protease
MSIEIIAVYKNLDDYVSGIEDNAGSAEMLWNKYAIDPYWKTLCQYAPYDLSDRKPKPITDIVLLKKQIDLLSKIDMCKLKDGFDIIAAALPNFDDDTIYIALYPLSDDDTTVKENQNGVIGASTYGNILININPLVDNFMDWIPYVFAHEYHHTVWGSYWYAMHGDELQNQFINSLLIDGEADCFALSFHPELRPKWLYDISKESEKDLWKNQYSKVVLKQDVDYCKYMFGDESIGIPWCAGYAIGHRIVNQFLINNPNITFGMLLEMQPLEIYRKSEYSSSLL